MVTYHQGSRKSVLPARRYEMILLAMKKNGAGFIFPTNVGLTRSIPKTGMDTPASTPEQFAALLRAECNRYGKLTASLGLKANCARRAECFLSDGVSFAQEGAGWKRREAVEC